jgi:hypothetical protein
LNSFFLKMNVEDDLMNVNYATTGSRRKNRQHSPMEV